VNPAILIATWNGWLKWSYFRRTLANETSAARTLELVESAHRQETWVTASDFELVLDRIEAEIGIEATEMLEATLDRLESIVTQERDRCWQNVLPGRWQEMIDGNITLSRDEIEDIRQEMKALSPY